MADTALTASELSAALDERPDWRAWLGSLRTAYVAKTSADAITLVTAIALEAEGLDHHPDVDWRYRHVFLRSTSHSAGDVVTAKDIELATRISAIARTLDAVAAPELVKTVELAIDTADATAISAVWTDAFGYRTAASGDLVDPFGRGPSIWFQQTGMPAGNPIHIDVHVPPEMATDAVHRLQDVGGRLVDKAHAPAWWVVADADGNRICICTPHD
jgi:4a-hydroxytetrahydrobiopterin dehydratase